MEVNLQNVLDAIQYVLKIIFYSKTKAKKNKRFQCITSFSSENIIA